MRARAEEDEECAIVDTGRSPLNVSCGGQAWPRRGPSVASRGQGVCPGAIGRALGRALTKRTSDTLNVAGRLGGPDSVRNTSGRDFRAPCSAFTVVVP